jgi:hypothetical protein
MIIAISGNGFGRFITEHVSLNLEKTPKSLLSFGETTLIRERRLRTPFIGSATWLSIDLSV